MLALRCAPPLVGIADAEALVHGLYGIPLALNELSGERDCNFRGLAADGREFVFKIVDGAAEPAAVDCQARVLRHLAEQDPALPVPRLVATSSGQDVGVVQSGGRSYFALLMDYLPGGLLIETTSSAPLRANVGGMLARVDRALQGFFHPALGQRIAWDVRRLPELLEFKALLEGDTRALVADIGAEIAVRLPGLRALRSQAIHGDCHGGNLLVAGGSVCGLLDFGDMIHAPRVLEPAVAMSELLTDAATPLDGLADIVAGYSQVEPLHESEVAALYDLIAARHAVTLLLHAWRRHHDPPGARVLDGAAANADASLRTLGVAGRSALTHAWHLAAGTAPAADGAPVARGVRLARRQRLLGAGAELFYNEPLHLVRGSDVWLYDPDGHAYLDVYNNVPHVGHCHPAVVRAIQRQSAILNTHTRYLHDGIVDYAERLTSRCPPHLDACIFVNSGSEANDVAWRMAQFATGEHGALVMAHAYHGITDAVAALTPGAGQPSDPRVVTLGLPPAGRALTERLSAAELKATAADVDGAVGTLSQRGFAPAAFFVDSALTSSGIFDPHPEWMTTVASRARAAGALVVADEVQYGLGRSGSDFWGFSRRGLTGALPDIVTLGKPVANGYPMGVVVAGRSLIEAFQRHFGFFSTFGGNPVAAAAATAVLRVIDDEGLMANARATGEYLREHLAALAGRHPCFGRVRGAGLLLGLEILGADVTGAKARTQFIVNRLAAVSRILIGSEGPQADILKLRPPLTFTRAHADMLVLALEAAGAALGASTRPGAPRYAPTSF